MVGWAWCWEPEARAELIMRHRLWGLETGARPLPLSDLPPHLGISPRRLRKTKLAPRQRKGWWAALATFKLHPARVWEGGADS